MTTIFRRAYVDKEKLREIILKNPGSLLEGLSFIDLELGTEEEGIIDFLGVDKKGRLVIVNFDTDPNDMMLVESLSQIEWLKKNEILIKRLFFSENVDFSQAPQILLIGPCFSKKLTAAVKQSLAHDMKLLGFKYIISQEKDAIIFEEISHGKNYKQPSPPRLEEKILTKESASLETVETLKKNEESKQDFILQEVSLSPQEIAEFMDFEKTLEEKKISA